MNETNQTPPTAEECLEWLARSDLFFMYDYESRAYRLMLEEGDEYEPSKWITLHIGTSALGLIRAAMDSDNPLER